MMSQFLQSLMAILYVLCEVCPLNVANLMLYAVAKRRAILFKGILANSLHINDAFCALSNWHRSGPGIVINNSLRLVDRECNLRTSLNSSGCNMPLGETALTSVTAVQISFASLSGILVVAIALVASLTILVLAIRTRNR